MRPHGLAQSNTGRCSGRRCGAPSRVIAPQQQVLAASISARVKPSAAKRSKPGSARRSAAMPSFSARNASPKVHLLNANLMSKAAASPASSAASAASSKPLAASVSWLIAGRALQRTVAERVAFDIGDRVRAVAERAQGPRHEAVDDLEIAAAGQFLELDQREIGLDAGRVAIHHQPDRAGRRDNRDLRVAETVLFRLMTAPYPRPRERPRRASGPGRKRRRTAPGRSPAPHSSSQPCPCAARRWLRMTRSIASRFFSKPGNGPSSPAISAEVA